MKPIEFDFNQIRPHSIVGHDRVPHMLHNHYHHNKLYLQKSRIQRLQQAQQQHSSSPAKNLHLTTNTTNTGLSGSKNPIISNTFEVVRLPKPKEIEQVVEEVLNDIEQ